MNGSSDWRSRLLGDRWPGRFVNSFHPLLAGLTEADGVVLQIVHNTRGSHIERAPGTTLEELLPDFDRTGLERHHVTWSIERLQTMNLVHKDGEGRWKTTWTGSGVDNWRKQLALAEEADGKVRDIAEPREGENGDRPMAGCTEFRHKLFAPAYCWCCKIQSQHVSEVVRSAERLLRSDSDSTASRSRFSDEAGSP